MSEPARCPACAHENRPGAKFCEDCATPLRRACTSCGAELRPAAKFCDACGTPAAGGAPARPGTVASARKVVTVVFADLVGSTALQERVDPESARRVMDAYYAALRGAVERHEGTVVKLLGDGVMAAFGVPQVAEDDAIRAVHAAVAMQEAFRLLATERGAVLGDAGLRVAVNTGEVVVSGANDDVVGDPVNVAARLQQEAHDGDVVLGEATRRLVDSLVTLEPLGSVGLRGRAEAVKAHRVVSLEAPGGTTTAAFVGREEELGRIGAVYDAAVRGPATRLAVLVGSPGLGKSRLIGEFARRKGDEATVVAARCDAARGATFAPLAEALRTLLGIEGDATEATVQRAIDTALPPDDDGPRIAAGIASLLLGSPAAPEETFFVVRRLLAALAAVRPVVLVIDDLQWAEPLLLDLVEHLVQWGTGTPLLVLIGARPELREVRSSLVVPGGLVSDVVTLAGLEARAAMRLAANVIGAADLPTAVAAKVLATSEGNPLFIGALVRMLVEEGALTRAGDRWTTGTALATLEMPPTIHALLAARIERLRPEERTVLERAAVVGRHFSRSAVAALLAGEGADLDGRLEALRRTELIEPDTGWFLGEPVLRFHHVLIRDAAYRRLLKETRAELHERLADWIEGRAGNAPEHDETIGRHLEQAHRLRGELGTLGEREKRLGERASARLATAGRRALARDDVPLAAGLLGRALARLDPGDAARADLALDWCDALLAAGDVGEAANAIDEVGRCAASSPRLGAWQTCFRGQLTVLTAPEALRATADEVADAARALATLGDAAGEATAHYVHALALARLGQVGGCEAALDRALAASRRADDRRRANTVLAIAPLAALWGPSPVTRASGRCLDVVRVLRITQGAPAVEAVALSCQGVLEALRGRTEAAKRMIASARELVVELGIAQRLFEADAFAGLVALVGGDGVAAEASLRGAYEGFRDLGLGIDAARSAALLARALLAQGRAAEAEALSHESEALAGDDLKAAIAWRGVRAEALARRGEHAAAVELATTAVEIAAATDALLDHADARLALAVALRAAGRDRDAEPEERRATELWRAKGATVLAGRAGRGEGAVPTAAIALDGGQSSAARRHVTPNLATAMVARLVETGVVTGNVDALRVIARDDYEEIDHTLGSRFGLDGAIASMRRLFRSRDPSYHEEPLATLGPSLVLCRRRYSASGAASGRYDVGAYENDVLHLFETDAAGLLRRSEVFAVAALGDAVARLYARHAELLPDGPERARAATTARLVKAMLTPSSERLEDVMAPDIQAVDHRTVGGGPAAGVDLWSRWRAASDELAADATYRVEDVLALGTEGLLRRTTESGTIRATGGAFASTSLLLSIFGPDGRQSRFELFDVGHEAEALARFEELTARPAVPHRPVRRVRGNAATALLARYDAALAAGDGAAIDALFAGQLEEIDHPTGSTYGRDGVMTTLHRLLGAQNPSNHHELLATLGDSLVLARRILRSTGVSSRRFDVGAYEYEALQVMDVDERGLACRSEIFAPERLGDAVARLYARHAELLADGPERDRATTTARAVAAFVGPIDPDGLATVCAPSLRGVDHRVFGTWTSRDAAELVEHFRRQLDLAPDWSRRVEDVAAAPHALLLRVVNFGTVPDGGGAFENFVCEVFSFDADGRVAHVDAFEGEQMAEALGRFEELTAAPIPARAPARRVRANAATRNAERIDAAVAARDGDALAAVLAGDLTIIHHPTGTTHDTAGFVGTWRRLFRADGLAVRHSPIASLGDALCLAHVSIAHDGIALKSGVTTGPAEGEEFVLNEVDKQGRLVRAEAFGSHRLRDAVVRLYERHAELLPGGPERDRAAATAHTVAVTTGPVDLERYAAVWAPTFRLADHRVFGTWAAQAPAEALHHFRLQLDLAPDFAHRYEDVLALEPHALLVRESYYGTARDSGGAFENRLCAIYTFGADGLVAHVEVFEAENEAEALARFDALTAADHPFANGAVRVGWEIAAAYQARDWERYARGFSATFRYVDRRHFAQIELDRDQYLAFVRQLPDSQAARLEATLLATRGERLGLARWLLEVSGDQVGPSVIEWLTVGEVDERGTLASTTGFDLDDLDAAYAELDRRWKAGEAAAHLAAMRAHEKLLGAIADRDWDALAASVSPDFHVADHRRLGWGSILFDPATFVQSQRALFELAPDYRYRTDHLRTAAGFTLSQIAQLGTRDGGPFENVLLWLGEIDAQGRYRRFDLYDLDHADQALARFAELADAGGAGPFANAAWRAAERIRALWMAREWQRLEQALPARFRYLDRRRGALLDLDGRQYVEFIRHLGDMESTRIEYDWSATRGERLGLARMRIHVAGGDVGPSELENLSVFEVDDHGEPIALVRFDPDDLDAAYAELDARWWAGEAQAHPAASKLVGEWESCFAERDWAPMEALLAADVVSENRRLAGWGILRGPVALRATWEAQVALAPDTRQRIDHVRTGERGVLWESTWNGTRDGGAFEIAMIVVAELNAEGRARRVDVWDAERPEGALARFAEVEASTADARHRLVRAPQSNAAGGG